MAYAKIRPKRGTKSQWEQANTVLAEGELGIEVPDAGIGKGQVKVKQGDGSTPWKNLPYAIDLTEFVNHLEDTENPHETTREQLGAAPVEFSRHAFASNGSLTDLLLIDDTQYGQANKPAIISTDDVNTLQNRPENFPESGTFIGWRIVDWYQSVRLVVRIHEAYPVPGRIWTNHYNVSEWSGWTCLDPRKEEQYGLGTVSGPRVADCDTVFINGFYKTMASTLNTPPIMGEYGYGILQVMSSSTDVYSCEQIYYAGGYHVLSHVARRKFIHDAWGEWEFENPPMFPGVEYRTTERHDGKPVYVKLVNCGAGANSTEKKVSHGAANAIVFDFGGYHLGQSFNTGSALPMPYYDYVSLYVTSNEIIMKTTADYSNYVAFVWMKYYKTTD